MKIKSGRSMSRSSVPNWQNSMNHLWSSRMIRSCDDMGQGQQAMYPEAFLPIWVPDVTSRDGCCILFATGLISHFSSNFASWEHLNVSAGPFYTTWKTLKLSGCHKHIFLFCSSTKQLCPTVIGFPDKSTWNSSLAKNAFGGTQHVESPQAQLCEKCECVRVCVCLCFKLLFVLCKTFFDLGDSGCEFDARQLWLKTFSWSTEDH